MFIKQMFNMMEVLTKIKLRIEVRGYLQNKVLIGYTWSPIASKETLNYFMVDSSKHKEILHQLYLIEKILQENFKNGVFVKLVSRYADCFPKYSS